jgi:hypothetical protein
MTTGEPNPVRENEVIPIEIPLVHELFEVKEGPWMSHVVDDGSWEYVMLVLASFNDTPMIRDHLRLSMERSLEMILAEYRRLYGSIEKPILWLRYLRPGFFFEIEDGKVKIMTRIAVKGISNWGFLEIAPVRI